MEKCYKLHGYPPGYKFNKNKLNYPSVNQVQESKHRIFQALQLSITRAISTITCPPQTLLVFVLAAIC